MIGRLRGELLELSGNLAVIDAGGVGYEILLPDLAVLQLPQIGELTDLYARQIFREDGVTLYGFTNLFQRRMFDLLLNVKGCGPKIALALIGQLSEDGVATAIVNQDTRALSRATGVGAKLAERIVLELKDKAAEESFQQRIVAASSRRAIKSDELVDALVALGYRRSEAEAAASSAREAAESVEDQLKAALKELHR